MPVLEGASQLRFTERATDVPVPFNETSVALPLEELLLIVSCPVAAPAVVGLNCICSVAVCEGVSVNGKLPPRIAKPAPDTDAELTVTEEVPDDVSVTDCVADASTATLPKLRVVALTVNCGFVAAAPVPLKDTTAVLPVVELLLIVSCPATDPVAVGLN